MKPSNRLHLQPTINKARKCLPCRQSHHQIPSPVQSWVWAQRRPRSLVGEACGIFEWETQMDDADAELAESARASSVGRRGSCARTRYIQLELGPLVGAARPAMQCAAANMQRFVSSARMQPVCASGQTLDSSTRNWPLQCSPAAANARTRRASQRPMATRINRNQWQTMANPLWMRDFVVLMFALINAH